TYLRNGGASNLVSSLAFGYRLPVTCSWSLTPVVRFGSGGSLDLCTSGSFASVGATSNYNLKVGDSFLSVTNYASYISSVNLWLGGINFNYNLHNYTFKKGISFTTCNAFCLWGRQFNFSFFFEDSYFAREKFYIRHFDDIGTSVIINGLNPCLG